MLRKTESFDHLAAADLAMKWSQYNNAATSTITATNARNGLSFQTNHYGTGWAQIFDAQATWIVGFAIRISDASTSRVILSFYDGATLHVDLRFQSATQGFVLTRNGTTIATGTTVLAFDTWYYVELKVTIADSPSGVGILKINGATDAGINSSALDTRNAGNASANKVEFMLETNSGSGHVVMFDDIYICDGQDGTATQGAANNDFLGDVRVEGVIANAAGNYAQFTPSASTNVSNVDDTSADGDSTYNSDTVSGHKDTFAMGNVTPTSGTVIAVQSVIMARKDDGGTRNLQPLFRSGGSDATGTSVALTDSYRFQEEVFGKNPVSGSAWTISDVNAVELGYKIP